MLAKKIKLLNNYSFVNNNSIVIVAANNFNLFCYLEILRKIDNCLITYPFDTKIMIKSGITNSTTYCWSYWQSYILDSSTYPKSCSNCFRFYNIWNRSPKGSCINGVTNSYQHHWTYFRIALVTFRKEHCYYVSNDTH